MAGTDRAEALRRLAELGVKTDPAAVAPEAAKVERTGDEVEAGGDTPRILVKPASLTYRQGGELRYAFAEVGDTVLLNARQAKRLDSLGVTVEVDATDDELEAAADGEVTDEALRTMSAADLVAHVAQNPGDRERVRELELERDQQRVTVLKATAGEDDDEELDD